MTGTMTDKILQTLRGSYPNDAWKLEGDRANEWTTMMLAIFGKYSDADVYEAVAKCVLACDSLPSMSIIRKAIVAKKNAVPDFVALPQSTNRIGKERIDAIVNAAIAKRNKQQESAKNIDPNDREYYSNLPQELIDFARRKFPDISLRLIDKNRSEFDFVRKQISKLDGFPLGLRMDKKTGDIYTVVGYPQSLLDKMKH